MEFIEKKGIPKTNLIAKGFGYTKQINNCGDNLICTDAKHALNRRTEIKREKD